MAFLGWISGGEEEVGGEREKEAFQISIVPLSAFPFHCYIRKEGKLRSRKIKGTQA